MPGAKHIIEKIVLECGHHLLFNRTHMPVPDEIVWCPRCNEYRKVPMKKEWYVHCLSCKYSHKFGADIDAALLADAKHLRKYPWHNTEVTQTSRIQHVA